MARERLLDEDGAQGVLAGLQLPSAQTHGQALDKIFERIVEPHLVDPTFVCDYPALISPFAKRKAGDPDVVDRYELFGANVELTNAFTELNDPDVILFPLHRPLAGRALSCPSTLAHNPGTIPAWKVKRRSGEANAPARRSSTASRLPAATRCAGKSKTSRAPSRVATAASPATSRR